MKRIAVFIVMLGLVANVSFLFAQSQWQVATRKQVPGQLELRGYGKVDAQIYRYIHADYASVDQAKFDAKNPDKAQTLLGKLLADLTLSPDVNTQMQTINGQQVLMIKALPQLCYVAASQGRTAIVWASTDIKSLAAILKPQMVDWDFVTKMPEYPMFLDRFDRYGWGMYGMGTLNNHHQWMDRAKDGSGVKDPIEDLDFLAKYNIRFEPWLDPAQTDNSDGLVANTEAKWLTSESLKRNLPVGTRVYGAIGNSGANWTDRRFADAVDQPADFMMSGWHGPEIYWKARHKISWHADDVQRYGTLKTQQLIAPYANMPHVMSFMAPHGELRHDPWYNLHADYSQKAHQAWHRYLQNKGYSLEKISKMYNVVGVNYSTWDQVPVPEYATFTGLGQRVLSLTGTWYAKAEKTLDQGHDENWLQADLNATWTSMHLPGSDSLFEIFPKKNTGSAWFRRTFEWSPQQQKSAKPQYLYWFPITHTKYHSGDKARFHSIYINGKLAGKIGQWGAIDIAPYLKTGSNQIALHLIGGVWNGRIYISTKAPNVYPYLGNDMNQLWMDWKDWLIHIKHKTWAQTLGGMRQVAPNQPIKFMAPIAFGTEKWLDLATTYGGWPHFTGEGLWFFPWYKRYSYLYGLPATSETAGPAKNVKDQNNAYRRVFLAGLNGHDSVFLTQTYTRDPQLRKWWIDHRPVIKQLGRYDIAGPQVLLYRSTRSMEYNPIKPYPSHGESAREVQSGWDWDLGRGTLQTLGHSYLYLDDVSLDDGKMYGYPLMIDSGNETVDAKAVDRIVDWVKTGGTYVALPFTGRNTLNQPDAWAIYSRCGVSVSGMRKLNSSKVIFSKIQTLFPGFEGQSFEDNGQSLDWVGNNHNLYSIEIDPGSGTNKKVIASYDNGKAAIVSVKMGRGQIILMGSAFWRDAQDRMGIWWPKKLETRFISSLLSGLNFEKPQCITNDPLVWAQPYRTNNGLDQVTTLVSWHEDENKTLDVQLNVVTKPQQLWRIAIDGIKPLPFEYKQGVVYAKVDVAAKEVVLLMMRDTTAGYAISHWWDYQSKLWKPALESKEDYSEYARGKWEDPTLDLMSNWQFTQQKPHASWLDAPGYADQWKQVDMGILNFQGAQDGKALWASKTFDLPQSWSSRGGSITLVSGAWRGPHYHSKASLYLNGKLLHGPTTQAYNSLDVTSLLRAGRNVIALAFENGDKYVGVSGSLYLYQRKAANRSVSLEGNWSIVDDQGKQQVMPLPTAVGKKPRGARPTMQLDIPESWRGCYRVRLYIEGDARSILGAYVNDHLVRRHHHHMGEICDIDITDDIRFGQSNTIELAGAGEERSGTRDHQRQWRIQAIRLDLFD